MDGMGMPYGNFARRVLYSRSMLKNRKERIMKYLLIIPAIALAGCTAERAGPYGYGQDYRNRDEITTRGDYWQDRHHHEFHRGVDEDYRND